MIDLLKPNQINKIQKKIQDLETLQEIPLLTVTQTEHVNLWILSISIIGGLTALYLLYRGWQKFKPNEDVEIQVHLNIDYQIKITK